MKRWYSFIVAILLVLTMTACQGGPADNATSEPTETTAPTETVSDNPLLAAELQSRSIRNGSDTETIGVSAYIRISKLTLEGISMEEYAEFCDTVVDHSIYNWVSIICDDGTGIQFTGSQYTIATYGTISYAGEIIEDIGYIRQTNNGFRYEEIN